MTLPNRLNSISIRHKHKPYVTQLITTDAKLQKANPKQYALAISDHYGKMEDSNDRIVNQLIVKDVLERVKNGGTNQLQMGLTELTRVLYGTPCRPIHIPVVWKPTSISTCLKEMPFAT